MVKLITYESFDEVIVCTEEGEEEVIKDYFEKGGRDKYFYDRHEYNDNCCVTFQPRVS